MCLVRLGRKVWRIVSRDVASQRAPVDSGEVLAGVAGGKVVVRALARVPGLDREDDRHRQFLVALRHERRARLRAQRRLRANVVQDVVPEAEVRARPAVRGRLRLCSLLLQI